VRGERTCGVVRANVGFTVKTKDASFVSAGRFVDMVRHLSYGDDSVIRKELSKRLVSIVSPRFLPPTNKATPRASLSSQQI